MNDITKIKVNGEPESSYQLYPKNEEFAKRSGGGGSGVQPDWNQNDDTQPDYVKNRPFYTGDPAVTVLVEESTASFSDLGGVYRGEVASTFSAKVGNTYKVYWDGAVYESVCADYGAGHTAIGNPSIAGAGADTGEPFFIVPNGQSIYIYTADTSASHTFSISGFSVEFVKIDEKYLPEYSVLYSGDPADWTLVKKKRMYDDFISGKLVLYEYSSGDSTGVVLSAFYNTSIGLRFVFFDGYNYLRSFVGNAFSEPLELSASGINFLVNEQMNRAARWKLYESSGSEVGDLLAMYVTFDGTTNKACIWEETVSAGPTAHVECSTIVTNGDSDIVLSSSTSGSTKKFKITVDDSGAITATEVT